MAAKQSGGSTWAHPTRLARDAGRRHAVGLRVKLPKLGPLRRLLPGDASDRSRSRAATASGAPAQWGTDVLVGQSARAAAHGTPGPSAQRPAGGIDDWWMSPGFRTACFTAPKRVPRHRQGRPPRHGRSHRRRQATQLALPPRCPRD
jgi:hypothetical protein